MSWALEEGTDLVLNMHLQPSGKPEPIRPSIGLYFSAQPPTRFPMLLQLENDGAIDIPPGAREFSVFDHVQLPVDVEILGLYPHAHYLGKRIEGSVVFPNGTTRRLILIEDWNLDWQAVYRLAEPLTVPRGSTLRMAISYDNSAANPRNPSRPPRRVRAGNRSWDEMSHLWIQVLPRRREDRLLLEIELMKRRLEKYPDDFLAHANLGGALQMMGRLDEAVGHFRIAARQRPRDATILNNLGAALKAAGAVKEAQEWFERALQIRPNYTDARYNLAHLHWEEGRLRAAIAHLDRILASNPSDLEVRSQLAHLYAETGDLDAAVKHFSELVRLRPADPDPPSELGRVEALRGRLDRAEEWFERALNLDPGKTAALAGLAQISAGRGDLARAAQLLDRALRSEPRNADLLNNLGITLAALGKTAEAVDCFEQALQVDPRHEPARANLAKAKAAGKGD